MQDSHKENSEITTGPFMNVLYDYAFKRVFGTSRNKDILISVLNAFLSDYTGEIKDIEYLPVEQLGIRSTDKKVSYDIYSKEGTERHFLLEMQHGRQTYYGRRTIAYVCRAVSNELRRGDLEYVYPSMVSLNLLDFHAPEIMGRSRFMQRVMLKNEENEIFSDKVMFVFADLTIFANGKEAVDLGDVRQKWAYYIKNIGHLTEEEVKGEKGIFKRFVDECRISNLNEEEMRAYNKSIMDYADVQDACVAAREDGFAEGEAWGEARGEARGRIAGLAEAKRKMAMEMLKKGLPVSMIADITGLKEEEIC